MIICAAAALLAATEWISVAEPHEGLRSAGVVAKTFVNEAPVVEAKWTVSGLGVFTCYVNGREVGAEDVLKPGFTHKEKRRNSFTYDVTPFLRRAAGATNVLAAVLTSGWWSDGIIGRGRGRENAFRGELTLGGQTVVTDASWVGARRGPVIWAGIHEGEYYDAREEIDLGAAETFAAWKAVVPNTEFAGVLDPLEGAKVGRRAPLKPIASWSVAGKRVYDFGQNCAGVPRFTIRAKAGVVFNYRLGEMLNDGVEDHHGDGPKDTVYLANLRGAASHMAYVTKEGLQVYIPKHTFYGYRYLQFDELSAADFELVAVESVPVSSVTASLERGTLEVGEKDVNRLIRNVYWGMLSNYLSVPTDCPQRNERLGWTGDTQVFAKTAGYFADTRGFFRKWMRDLVDSQEADGYFPDVAPRGCFGGRGQAAWGDAGVIVPYRVWRQFGDEEIVRENWPAMVRYIEALDRTDYTMQRGGWVLADWLSYENISTNQRLCWQNGTLTDEHLSYQNYLNACYLVWDAELMTEMLPVVAADRRLKDAAWFTALGARTRARILTTWFKPDGSLIDLFAGMQTPRLMALKIGIGDTKRLARELVDIIRANGDRLATGFVGTGELPEVLGKIGAYDLVWTLILQHEFPGWLYSVDQGATTVWERWNSYTKAKGFGDVGMNSFNHYAYGSIVGWIFEEGAGIQPGAEPGYRRFVLAPHPDRRLGSLTATYRTDFGEIRSAWSYAGDRCTWTFTIPEGTAAEVHPPCGGAARVYGPGTYTL
ncbi:MAG: family 78 glycoside hydrolase catalytic domain [Kiritimatiellia bacterium]